MRIGYGYDAHRLVPGRKMVLCGLEIPCSFGPDGYSDGDAALHALTDAILGAAALGDIGMHFPVGDERWKDCDSKIILSKSYELVRESGYKIGNADVTIVLQAPKIAPYIQAMRECIAKTLDCDASQISVKATTEEKMGFTGSGEGVSAMAAVLLEKSLK